jgi:hypothetical protein
MGQDSTVSIRPRAGGPHLKKNACLSVHHGVLEATDPRGHTHAFDLSDGNGPYEFRYGMWKGDANYALVDRSGHAVLVVDTTAFLNEDISRLQDATGLNFDGTETEPPRRRDTVALVNLPYLKWAMFVSGVGTAAFGLWSVTHIEFFVLGITLPALIIVIPLAVFARRSILSPEDAKAEFARVQPQVEEALALEQQYLAEHSPPATPPDGPSGAASSPPAGSSPQTHSDGD